MELLAAVAQLVAAVAAAPDPHPADVEVVAVLLVAAAAAPVVLLIAAAQWVTAATVPPLFVTAKLVQSPTASAPKKPILGIEHLIQLMEQIDGSNKELLSLVNFDGIANAEEQMHTCIPSGIQQVNGPKGNQPLHYGHLTPTHL